MLSSIFFFGPGGHEQGFDHLLQEYGRHLNRCRGRRNLPMVVVFLHMPYERLLLALNKGYVDVVTAGMTVSTQRAKLTAFARPYLTGVQEVVAGLG